jgi:hypothetical protein
MKRTDDLEPKAMAERDFKTLRRAYILRERMPTATDLEKLGTFAGTFDCIDLIEWQEETGLRHGVIFDAETGKVTFEEYILDTHAAIVSVFNREFLSQFEFLWGGSDPNFESVGQSCKLPNNFWYRMLTLQIFNTPRISKRGPTRLTDPTLDLILKLLR